MHRLARASVSVFALVATLACGGGSAPGAQSPSAPGTTSSGGEASDAPAASGSPKEVDCGDFTTCAIAGDGSARCWGKNKSGELGDGGGADRSKGAPVPGLGRVRTVALAAKFACALLEDKKVKCWGTGRVGNDGSAVSNAKPTPVAGVDGAEELVASGLMACARTASGVACWGADAATIGDPPKGAFTQIAVGFTHACALDAGGAVTCWGSGDWGGKGPFAKPPIKGAVHLATGDRHGCVVTGDKKVQCWGTNDAGQLGIKPDVEVHKKPVTVPGVDGAVKVLAGEASTCAVLADGSARCWGANGEGELGLGKQSSDERPQRVTVSDVDEMCLGGAHGCALTKAGKLVCWGSNAFGQLGDGSKERRLEPVSVAW